MDLKGNYTHRIHNPTQDPTLQLNSTKLPKYLQSWWGNYTVLILRCLIKTKLKVIHQKTRILENKVRGKCLQFSAMEEPVGKGELDVGGSSFYVLLSLVE